MTDRAIRLATVSLLAFLAALAWLRLETTSSITHFLPSPEEVEQVALVRELVESDLSRTMLLRIGGEGDRAGAARALAGSLRELSDVARVQAGDDPAAIEALARVVFPRRIFLASSEPEREIPALVSKEALGARADALRDRLAGPLGILVARQAPGDPLDLVGRILARLRDARPASRAGEATVLVRTRPSAFDSERQTRLLDEISERFRLVAARHGPALRLEQSGVNRIAVATERSMRRDVQTTSIVSWAAVVAIFFGFFRSLRALVLAFLPPTIGIAFATCVAGALLGPVHGATLGFGLALVGVAIDYPIHLIVHHALAAKSVPARDSARGLRRPLVVSGATTALCFGVLSTSRFPGVEDMGSFAAIGILTALAATLFALPAFLPTEGSRLATPALRHTAAALGEALAGFARLRPLGFGVVAAACVVAALGIPRVDWSDDPAALSSVDPSLLEEDRRVRTSASGVDLDRFVVAQGETAEQALERNDAVYEALEDAAASGHLDGVRSLHAALFSESLQRRNLEAFRAERDLSRRIEDAFSERGFERGRFDAFTREVFEPSALPLRPEDLADTPLAGLVDATLVPVRGGFAVVTYLRGVRDAHAVAEAIEAIPGVRYLDQAEILRGVFEGFRRTTLRLLGVSALLVLAVLVFRYRSARRALLASLPALVAPAATLGVFGLAGFEANLLAVVSLLLVMGMGVDYGVFMVDACASAERFGATAVALLVSCLTSIAVFGVLALSTQPALRAIGLGTGIGLGVAFVLAVGTVALAGDREPA